MKICLLFPGKIKPKALAPAEEEYLRRLRTYGVEAAEYKPERIDARPPEQVKTAEALRILKRVSREDYLIACDERGKGIHTQDLAGLFKELRQGRGPAAGRSRMVIVVGGALGLGASVCERADAVWSLSSLVMAGGVARVVLLENLYRAFTMADGHPYHNE